MAIVQFVRYERAFTVAVNYPFPRTRSFSRYYGGVVGLTHRAVNTFRRQAYYRHGMNKQADPDWLLGRESCQLVS